MMSISAASSQQPQTGAGANTGSVFDGSQNPFLDMLNASFINIPLLSDQDTIDLKCPLPVDEAILMTPQANQKKMQQEVFTPKRYFPTSAMYNRQNHF